ncbi:MAG TPA: chemotaxis protein CheB [Gaiellaceae bacterium]|nr:chemotaxis protein CheB [Gaiellaceae bacterium]
MRADVVEVDHPAIARALLVLQYARTVPSAPVPPSAGPMYVVIGTSTGGTQALSRIFKDLPSDFPGALLIVLHVAERGEMAWLAGVLASAGHLPVKVAEAGEVIQQGTAYLAPAGTHLLTEGDRIRLGSGPAEQFARPAIDALFRSAATAFGQRVIGVVLTGMLRDGSLGLRAVGDAGGITIVEDPATAHSAEMPKNALRALNVDYCVGLSDVGPLLDLLVRRAGSKRKDVLETGLASAVRLMKDRLHLLTRLHEQSRRNPKTARYIEAEIAALGREIARIQKLVPSV